MKMTSLSQKYITLVFFSFPVPLVSSESLGSGCCPKRPLCLGDSEVTVFGIRLSLSSSGLTFPRDDGAFPLSH